MNLGNLSQGFLEAMTQEKRLTLVDNTFLEVFATQTICNLPVDDVTKEAEFWKLMTNFLDASSIAFPSETISEFSYVTDQIHRSVKRRKRNKSKMTIEHLPRGSITHVKFGNVRGYNRYSEKLAHLVSARKNFRSRVMNVERFPDGQDRLQSILEIVHGEVKMNSEIVEDFAMNYDANDRRIEFITNDLRIYAKALSALYAGKPVTIATKDRDFSRIHRLIYPQLDRLLEERHLAKPETRDLTITYAEPSSYNIVRHDCSDTVYTPRFRAA